MQRCRLEGHEVHTTSELGEGRLGATHRTKQERHCRFAWPFSRRGNASLLRCLARRGHHFVGSRWRPGIVRPCASGAGTDEESCRPEGTDEVSTEWAPRRSARPTCCPQVVPKQCAGEDGAASHNISLFRRHRPTASSTRRTSMRRRRSWPA